MKSECGCSDLRRDRRVGMWCVGTSQLLQIVRWSEWSSGLLPIVVLVAEKASILSLATLGGLAIVALLASFNTRDQDVCCLLAGERASVAGLALDAHVGIVTEHGVGQPHRFDV